MFLYSNSYITLYIIQVFFFIIYNINILGLLQLLNNELIISNTKFFYLIKYFYLRQEQNEIQVPLPHSKG